MSATASSGEQRVTTDRQERVARRFRLPVLLATLLVIPQIVAEAVDGSRELHTGAAILNWVIWLVFVAELIATLAVVDDRRAWLRSHPLMVVIVLVTVPFLPASLQVARLFRLARVIRLVLVLHLARRLLSPSGLQFATATVALAVLGGAAAFEAAERVHDHTLTLFDSLWWAMATVTTVGYGDVTAHTVLGRLVGMVLMVIGIGFVALLTGALAQRFLQEGADGVAASGGRTADEDGEILAELKAISARLARLEERVVRSERSGS